MKGRQEEYSKESIELDRFLPCFAALEASLEHDESKIELARVTRNDTSPKEALRTLGWKDFPVRFLFYRDQGQTTVEFRDYWTLLVVQVICADEAATAKIHLLVRQTLGAVEPTDADQRGLASLPHINDLLWKIFDTVRELSVHVPTASEVRPGLRCFMSFRFDDHSKALALELREFLELVDVEVVSGLGFEPRSVSEKILERLAGPLDLFIVLDSVSGDSAWLDQEIGAARARDLPVLVLREEGTSAQHGILGDTEFLLFPKDNVSRAFVGVLQALQYIGRKRNRVIPTG